MLTGAPAKPELQGWQIHYDRPARLTLKSGIRLQQIQAVCGYAPGGAGTSSLNFDHERSRSLIMVMESGHVMRNVGSS